jgi:3-dehydroquinate synthase
MKELLHVALGNRSYDIAIGDGLLAQAGALIAPLLRGRRVIIVSDDNVAGLYLKQVQESLEARSIRQESVVLPHGEQSKSFATLETLLERLLALNPDRRVVLIALGGGVIGDITGFAASILLRGVDFIQVPTTLLAQVDSSVGGKTGINARQGKNLIGSFYQPRLVIADIAALLTLPRRELLAGYAEAVKYGVINNAPFFDWLEKHGNKALENDRQALAHIVRESCKAKAAIVASDEREAGVRALLNFGHTLGHALEAETGFSDLLLHGEAVAVGMVLAMRLSLMRGLCGEQDYERLKTLLDKAGLRTSPRAIGKFDVARLIAHCTHDKKAIDGGLTFVLAETIGKTTLAADITKAELQALLEREL